MELAASYIAVVQVASKLCLSLVKFISEAKDANETTSDLVKRVVTLQSTLETVYGVLETRANQRHRRPFVPFDDDIEKGVWDQAEKVLQRCEDTVKRLEGELDSLGGGESKSWPQLASLQLKLKVRNPAISRIEKDIDANVSAAQLMITCFQP